MLNNLAFLSLICFLKRSSGLEYPLVGFEDYLPEIDPNAEKLFTTTIGLLSLRSEVEFNEREFLDLIVPYYSSESGLSGYVNLTVTDAKHVETNNLTLVTYQARYVYSLLAATADDEVINDALGTYENVVAGFSQNNWSVLAVQGNQDSKSGYSDITIIEDEFTEKVLEGSGGSILDDYYFPNTSDYFQFSGNSICSDPGTSCYSSYTRCIETLDGVNVSCMSQCKFEKCYNDAYCKQENYSSEPACMCPSTNTVWYIGEHCQTIITEWMLILLLVLIGIFFVMECILLIWICSYLINASKENNRKKSREIELQEKRNLAEKNLKIVEFYVNNKATAINSNSSSRIEKKRTKQEELELKPLKKTFRASTRREKRRRRGKRKSRHSRSSRNKVQSKSKYLEKNVKSNLEKLGFTEFVELNSSTDMRPDSKNLEKTVRSNLKKRELNKFYELTSSSRTSLSLKLSTQRERNLEKVLLAASLHQRNSRRAKLIPRNLKRRDFDSN